MNQDDMTKVDSGLGELRDRVGNLERGLTENTEATKRIESSIADLVDFFDSLKGAFKVLNWVGRIAKPFGYIAGAVASGLAMWTAFKSGVGPK